MAPSGSSCLQANLILQVIITFSLTAIIAVKEKVLALQFYKL